MNREQLAAQLRVDEGDRKYPYIDSEKHLSIGVGHNLDAKGLSDRIRAFILAEDMDDAEASLDAHLPWWRGMSEARQNAIANMMFNMGPGSQYHGLLSFKHALAAMQAGDWPRVAAELRASKWAMQVGARAERIIDAFLKG